MRQDSSRVDPHEKVAHILKVISVVILIFSAFEIYVSITKKSEKSPFLLMEWRAGFFVGDVARGMYKLVWSGEHGDSHVFHSFRDDDGSPGFRYQSSVYGEEIKYSDEILLNVELLDPFSDGNIDDYWIQGFKVSENKEVFSVCYRFKSGAVLQVADLYDIYGKTKNATRPHKYRVVRMFFVGDRYKARKYRRYFGHAYFETESNIQHYKQLMKEGKGWVRQANRYIDEKEVKKEKPILDYRTNPDYYTPVSRRKPAKNWFFRLFE